VFLPAFVAAEESHMGTAQQQNACRADAQRYCRGIKDDLAVADCLRANLKKVRPACRKVVEGGQ
jgi:hypothetical protein